jgi:hypothetical protein
VWRGQPLTLILDHINGNNTDNRPENLRLLCPNCDSLLSTRGGKNKGRVRERGENHFLLVEPDGRRALTVFGTGGSTAGGSAEVAFGRASPAK